MNCDRLYFVLAYKRVHTVHVEDCGKCMRTCPARYSTNPEDTVFLTRVKHVTALPVAQAHVYNCRRVSVISVVTCVVSLARHTVHEARSPFLEDTRE